MSRERDGNPRRTGDWITIIRKRHPGGDERQRYINRPGQVFTIFVEDIPDYSVATDVAIQKANGIWINDKELKVKVATFVRRHDRHLGGSNNRAGRLQGRSLVDKCSPGVQDQHLGRQNQSFESRSVIRRSKKQWIQTTDGQNMFSSDRRSFTEVVNKGSNLREGRTVVRRPNDHRFQNVDGQDMHPIGRRPYFEGANKGRMRGMEPMTVKVHSIGNGWLYRSVVATLLDQRAPEYLLENFIQQNDGDTTVRRMGNKQALLTFLTKEKMELFIDNHNKLGSSWFSSIRPWSVDLVSNFGREVWLSCYGVPIHAWNTSTFLAIGQCWGEVKIYTTHALSINHQMNLVVGLVSFNIRVAEEQAIFISNSDFKCQCLCHKLDKNRDDGDKSSTGDDAITVSVESNGNNLPISPNNTLRNDGPLLEQNHSGSNGGIDDPVAERSPVSRSGREGDVDDGRDDRIEVVEGGPSVPCINDACLGSCGQRLYGENSTHRDNDGIRSAETVPLIVTQNEVEKELLGREDREDRGPATNCQQIVDNLASFRPILESPYRISEGDKDGNTSSPSRVNPSACDERAMDARSDGQTQQIMMEIGDAGIMDNSVRHSGVIPDLNLNFSNSEGEPSTSSDQLGQIGGVGQTLIPSFAAQRATHDNQPNAISCASIEAALLTTPNLPFVEIFSSQVGVQTRQARKRERVERSTVLPPAATLNRKGSKRAPNSKKMMTLRASAGSLARTWQLRILNELFSVIGKAPALRGREDELWWNGDSSGRFFIKDLYDRSVSGGPKLETAGLVKIWACAAPEKGQATLCTFCMEEEESGIHLFVQCRLSRSVWMAMLQCYGIFEMEGTVRNDDEEVQWLPKAVCAPQGGDSIFLGDMGLELGFRYRVRLVSVAEFMGVGGALFDLGWWFF
ncbi:hypothetical protein Dimus_018503 [Dionaea muscipula]